MKTFSNNQELYDYLAFLSSLLKKRGLAELSEALDFARGQASGISTEFLGESRMALRRVLQEGCDALTEPERVELSDALMQLEKAINQR